MPKTEAVELHVGDRVRAEAKGRVRVDIISQVSPDGWFMVGGRTWTADCLTLVERAHYAEPGVTLVAMDAQRIAALQCALTETLYHGEDTLTTRLIRGILAEARGEAQHG